MTTQTSPAPAPPASADVQALLDQLTVLAAADPANAPGPQALADTAALLAARETLNALTLTRLADVSARQLYTLDGAPTAAAWVAGQQCGLDRGEVALAQRLARYRVLAGELLAGRLSIATGERVAKSLTSLRPHVDRPDGLVDGQPGEQVVAAVVTDGVRSVVAEARGGLEDDDALLVYLSASLGEIAARPISQLDRLEQAFVLLAAHVEPAQLPAALARLVDAVLPVQLEQRAEEGRRKRGLDLRRRDDGSGYDLRGSLDLECGELLHTVLQAEQSVDPDNPADTEGWAQARAEGWQPGDDMPDCGGPRSLREKRHDALRSGLRRYLDSGVAGLREKVAPHIAVTVGLDALHGAPGSLPAQGASGASLPASLVQAWWCDSAVSRFVLSLGRRVIETSHTERTLKPHERRAKHIETGGQCQGAGCVRGPGHRLVPHHVTAWAIGGTTSLADTVLVCEQTHHDLHAGGRTIRLKDGRWLSAAGWVEGPGPWERQHG